jgi:uncharacterized membrane protein YsdA (DUF1294 family)/cold shock CspA family protein
MITLRSNAGSRAAPLRLPGGAHRSPVKSDPPSTAKIVEWDYEKGYGFLLAGKGRVFLHRRDFIDRHRRPVVGDVIGFTLGQDAKGRACATNAVHVMAVGRITVKLLAFLACLLVLPAIALHRSGVGLHWAGAYLLVLAALTYGSYAMDKRRAQTQDWRLPETRLHLLELLGGWPGAFLAQRQLRHKCSKASYQFVFWLIVLLHQFAAVDSLQNWEYSRAALQHLQKYVEHGR